jgi:hypothetical protein
MAEWIRSNPGAVWGISLLSVACFIATLLLLPLLIVHIPEDYFVRKKRLPVRRSKVRTWLYLPVIMAKNLLGILFIIAGMAMLVLPGQGILSILIGITLTNFPGKFAMEQRLIRQPTVNRLINWIRTKGNKPALKIPGDDGCTL